MPGLNLHYSNIVPLTAHLSLAVCNEETQFLDCVGSLCEEEKKEGLDPNR